MLEHVMSSIQVEFMTLTAFRWLPTLLVWAGSARVHMPQGDDPWLMAMDWVHPVSY